MKVIHLNITENFGGAAKAVNRLHHGLINSGIDSRMLVMKKETSDPSVLEISTLYSSSEKGKVLLTKIRNRIKRLCVTNGYSFNNSETRIYNVLKRLDFDILHLHWVTDGYLNFTELNGLSQKIVWTMHDCAAFTGICHVIGTCNNFTIQCGRCPQIGSLQGRDISNKEFLRKAGLYKKLGIHFISPSKWIAETASKSPLLNNKRISIIPHGLDIEIYKPISKRDAKRALQIDERTKIVLCGAVSLGDENKGMQLFLRAASYIRKNFNTEGKIEVFFFGDSFEKLKDLGFDATYLGYIDNELLISMYYSAADVVVVPSKQESFGQIASEALACGTPVAAFGTTGLLDIIDHKLNGYLAKPFDSEDLGAGIIWCLNNNSEGILSKHARDKVLSSFTLQTCVNRYIALYEKLLVEK